MFRKVSAHCIADTDRFAESPPRNCKTRSTTGQLRPSFGSREQNNARLGARHREKQ
jgi:hypothetical protein